MAKGAERSPLLDRIARRVAVGLPDECWPWTGFRNEGRPRIEDDTRRIADGTLSEVSPRRAWWEWHTGRTLGPDDRLVMTCRDVGCMNPRHMERFTHLPQTTAPRQSTHGYSSRGDGTDRLAAAVIAVRRAKHERRMCQLRRVARRQERQEQR